jgi:hypothetical protein
MGIFYESQILHFFSSDWVDDCVGVMPLRTMVISEGNSHVGGVHSTEVVLRQVAGRESLGASGHHQR